MIKRTTALFFILLASMILLAHAVIPHHHHQKLVCVENSCCQNDGNEHKHTNPERDHEHDGKSSKVDCILKQAVVLPSNKEEQVYKSFSFTNNHSPFIDFQFTSFKTGPELFMPVFYLNTFITSITFSYSNFVTLSLGLRAPPVI